MTRTSKKQINRLLASAALLLILTGCASEADVIREKAKVVQTCADAGGSWYSVPGWGESCHFDTRPTS